MAGKNRPRLPAPPTLLRTIRAGFGSGTGEVISNGDGTVEYAKTWKSHDAQGAPDGGLIDVRVDAAAGMLLSFYYRPGAQKRSPG